MTTRREFLALGAGAVTTALAGCNGLSDDGPVQRSVVTTTETGCENSPSATVSVSGTTVTVTGTLIASTPCHTAQLAKTSVEDGTVTLTFIPQSDGSGGCTQCLGGIDFECEVEFAELPEMVRVQLGGQRSKTVEKTVGSGSE